jgi:putative glutamate/gamma-aminobutyrate antiporter
MEPTKSVNMTTTRLVFMTGAAVFSLRGLSFMAMEELTMFFYVLFGTVFFLIPASMVSAELGGAFASTGGGVYTWVKEAFHKKLGFLAIWLQWIQNVVYYPILLAFAASIIAYMIGKPELSNNGTYVGIFCIVVYWISTIITLNGTQLMSKIASYGFLLGTIIPGAVLIIFTIIYIIQGNPLAFLHPSAVDTTSAYLVEGISYPRWFPHITSLDNVTFLAVVILLFAGIEVQAVHAAELKNPSKQFPKVLFFAALLIFFLEILGALSISVVLPETKISLQSGLMQAFENIFVSLGVKWLLPVICILMAFGVLGSVISWIAGPSRGLLWTAKDGLLPPALAKVNKNGIQQNILIIQGLIVTLLSSIYFIISNVGVAFFLLGALTVGLYLIMYMMMYAAGIRLRYSQPDLQRSFKVPGGNKGMWAIAGIGFMAVLFAFIVSFFPPSQLPVGSPLEYVGLVLGGTVLFTVLPFLLTMGKNKK